MLIRIDHDRFAECPDDLAALILTDSFGGRALTDYSISEINALIHWTLGTFATDGKTWEENLQGVREIYANLPGRDPDLLPQALLMVQRYNQLITHDEIGRVDADWFQEENVASIPMPHKLR